MKIKKLPPLSIIRCPCCNTIGKYEVDEQLNTYCKSCGLVIDSPYHYTGGIKYSTLCDFYYKKRIRGYDKKWKKKIK